MAFLRLLVGGVEGDLSLPWRFSPPSFFFLPVALRFAFFLALPVVPLDSEDDSVDDVVSESESEVTLCDVSWLRLLAARFRACCACLPAGSPEGEDSVLVPLPAASLPV